MKDDLEKIDEQIENILASEKKLQEKAVKVEEEKKEDITDFSDTKRIEQIEEIKEKSPVVEEKVVVQDSTKKIEVVEEIEEEKQEMEKEKPIEAKKEDSEKEPFQEPKKKDKKKIIFLVLGIIFILLLIILLFLLFSSKKDSTDKVEKISEEEKTQILKKYGDAMKGIIAVYYDKKEILLTYEEAIELVNFDYDVVCQEHEIYEDGSIYLNSCTVDQKKINSSYGEKQEKKKVQISEGSIKVYVSKDRGVATFEEPKDGTSYDIYGFDITEEHSELKFLNAKSSDFIYYLTESSSGEFTGHLINFKTGKKALEDISYDSILPIKVGEEYDTTYAIVNIKNKWSNKDQWGIYNIKNNIRVVNNEYDIIGVHLYMGVYGPMTEAEAIEKNKIAVFSEGYTYENNRYGVIDYTNGQTIVSDCKTLLKSGKYLWCVPENGNGIIYDNSGKKYLNNSFDKLYGIVDGQYILVQDKENVKLVNIKGTTLYNYGKYNLKDANYGIGYDEGAIFQFTNTSLGEDYDYDLNESCLEFIYHGSTKKGEVKTSYCGGIAKPILYLYPEEKTNVSVSFEHPELLETTYPKFKNEWKVTASPNGDLIDENGKYYYALYWDEKKVHTVDFKTGFYVEKENAISFLEEKLEKIGLSNKEKNEFIMYWLPILEKNGKNLVYFELTEERESVNKINITPKPDSLLRIVIHVKKVDSKVKIKEQSLPTFERKGFTAVEWGGTTY